MKHLKSFNLFEGKKDPEKRKTGEYKWYPADEFMQLIEAVGKKAPDMKWGVPADIFGHATQYMKFEDAKKELEKVAKHWEDKKDPVMFSMWSLSDNRLNYVNTTRLLAQGLEKVAAFVEPGRTTSVSITMKNKGTKDFGDAMSRGDYGSLD